MQTWGYSKVLIHFLGCGKVVNGYACSQGIKMDRALRISLLLKFWCHWNFQKFFHHTDVPPPRPPRWKNLSDSVIILWFIYLHLLLPGDLNTGNDKMFLEHRNFTCPLVKISKALRRLISKLLNAGSSFTYASVSASHIVKWKIRKQSLKKRSR